MGRDPAPRRHYRNDAITVNRIIGAIELDTWSDPAWKANALTKLREGFRALLDHKPAPEPTKTGNRK